MVLPQTWKEILTEEEGSGGSLDCHGLLVLSTPHQSPFLGKPLALGICSLSQLILLSQLASNVTYFPQAVMLTLGGYFHGRGRGD